MLVLLSVTGILSVVFIFFQRRVSDEVAFGTQWLGEIHWGDVLTPTQDQFHRSPLDEIPPFLFYSRGTLPSDTLDIPRVH